MPGWLAGAPSRDISFKLLGTGIHWNLFLAAGVSEKIYFLCHIVLANLYRKKLWKIFVQKNIDRLATDCRLSCYEFCISAPAKTSGKKLEGEREGPIRSVSCLKLWDTKWPLLIRLSKLINRPTSQQDMLSHCKQNLCLSLGPSVMKKRDAHWKRRRNSEFLEFGY